MTTTMRLSDTAQTDYDDDSSRPESGPDWGLGFTAKQLADLVGVTVRTLRYYHQIGLLAEPRRAPGGLRYTPEHALRVLRIKRLTLIGLALDEVADVLGRPRSSRAARILADLDRALADRAVEIQAQRRVIRQLQDTDSPVDVLPEFARHLATLRRLSATGDTERADQALIDIVAGGADASAAQAGLDLLDRHGLDA